MTDCTLSKIEFPPCRGRRVEADFAGGDISSNGGAPLLALADRRLGLLSGLARRLGDARQAGKVKHRHLPLLRQRVFALALGYEDVNDHDGLRDDGALQTAGGRDRRLASSSTVGRLDRAADRSWAAHVSMVETFIASFDEAPTEPMLDSEATDDAVHGDQEGRFFDGYDDRYCFLPRYVFCGGRLLVSYLRPSNIDGAKHAGAILKLRLTRLRQAWPDVPIMLRADSGFCRHEMLSWCAPLSWSYLLHDQPETTVQVHRRFRSRLEGGMALPREVEHWSGDTQRKAHQDHPPGAKNGSVPLSVRESL